MLRTCALLALLALGGCVHSGSPAPPAPSPQPAPVPAATPAAPKKLPGEEILQQRPVLPQLRPFDAPIPKLTALPNGLKLYVVERPGDGIEALHFVVRRGSAVDPPELPGLASLTAAMLEAGSAGKSQTAMAAAVEAIGAELRVLTDEDNTAISIAAMPSRLDTMVSLLADVALRPNFEPAELERLKGQREAELIAARAQPSVAAGWAWFAAAYGDHPLGHPPEGTVPSVRKMTLDRLKTFFRTFSPKDAAIIAVGGAAETNVAAALTRAFGGWRPGNERAASAAEVLAKAKLAATRPRLVLVDFPDRPQSVIRVGQPAVSRASPDYLALRVLNSILGGSFTSRLVQNLRERHGYTYSANSRFSFGAGPGPFLASSSVKTDVTGAALKEMMFELERAVAEPLSQEELEKGKALLAFDLVQSLEQAPAAAATLSQLFLYDLPLDEFRTYVTRLKAVSAEQVQAAARRVLNPATMTITVVGDARRVEPQLTAESKLALPPAQRRSATGEPLPSR